MKNNKGQSGAIVMVVVGIVIGVILLIGVAVPVTQSTVTTANFTAGSTNATIANNLVTFILIGTFVLIATIAFFGMRK